jgi:GntR family transcriptional regulator/MocR family aminotransferase
VLSTAASARSTGAWIVEDDCDSELRYAGRPLASLKGLDAGGSVLYVGTFGRSVLRSLRVGYVVAHRDLAAALVATRGIVDRHPPPLEQVAVAEFMARGHFATHVRRMRKLYAERQRALLAAAAAELGDRLELAPRAAGMHLVGWLPRGVDVAVARAARARGVVARPLADFRIARECSPGLLLGYTGARPARLRGGMWVLAEVLREQSPEHRPDQLAPYGIGNR